VGLAYVCLWIFVLQRFQVHWRRTMARSIARGVWR
jgi:hypothetical protein